MKAAHDPIALTVLGGFLGAGKTTLLNHLLRNPFGERVLVMVNDFGSIDIDAQLIAQRMPNTPDGIISLANGCACCAIGGDLMQAFLKVLSLPERPDRVLVEASGVGDPARIAEIGRAGGRFRCEGVITVVDAEAVQRLAADRYVGETVMSQLRAADLLLVNKTDLVSPQALADLRSWLATQAPRVPLLETSMGVVDTRLVLGPALHSALDADDGTSAAQAQAQALDHASRFVSTTLTTTYPFRRQALETALDALPAQVLRAKGLVFLEGEDAARVLQVCGRRWSMEPSGTVLGNMRSRIVFIASRETQELPFHPWSHFGSALALAQAPGVAADEVR